MADEVYEAGLRLDLDERTVVAHRLLASLRTQNATDQADVDAARREEISSRVSDILDGTVQMVSFEDTRARAHAMLDDLRR
ncbi:MAG: addiction module protein [Micrococcales bacterium]|nr:addiction module protein [Micrococcales bacterium]